MTTLHPEFGRWEGSAYRFKEGRAKTPRARFLIRPWLRAGSVTVMNALMSAGKTATLADIAMHLACDLDWHGYASARSVYVKFHAGENAPGLANQLRAWKARHGVAPADDRLEILAGDIETIKANPFSDPAFAEWFGHATEQNVPPGADVLVILDPWWRFAAPFKSDAEHVAAVFNIEEVARSTGATVLIGAGNFPSPSNDMLDDMADGVWSLTRDKRTNRRRLKSEVVRCTGERPSLAFNLDPVPFCDPEPLISSTAVVVSPL